MPGNPKYRYRRVNGKHRLEHRILMERKLGRTLGRDECVHHKNRNGRDNRLSNLCLMSRSAHSMLHKPRRLPTTKTCPMCGRMFTPTPAARGKQKTCSRRCGYQIGALVRPRHRYSAQIIRLRKSGWSFQRIGRQLSIGTATAWRVAAGVRVKSGKHG